MLCCTLKGSTRFYPTLSYAFIPSDMYFVYMLPLQLLLNRYRIHAATMLHEVVHVFLPGLFICDTTVPPPLCHVFRSPQAQPSYFYDVK